MFLLVVLVLCSCKLFVASSSAIDVLFVLHDAGESYFSQPTMQDIEGVFTYAVLTLGEPANTIFDNYTQRVTLQDLGIDTANVTDGSDRGVLLDNSQVEMILKRFSPEVVVEGMVYAMQAQIGEAFKNKKMEKDIPIVSIYDSFSLFTKDSLAYEYFIFPTTTTTTSTASSKITECFFCAQEQTDELAKMIDTADYTKSIDSIVGTTTGSPTPKTGILKVLYSSGNN